MKDSSSWLTFIQQKNVFFYLKNKWRIVCETFIVIMISANLNSSRQHRARRFLNATIYFFVNQQLIFYSISSIPTLTPLKLKLVFKDGLGAPFHLITYCCLNEQKCLLLLQVKTLFSRSHFYSVVQVLQIDATKFREIGHLNHSN